MVKEVARVAKLSPGEKIFLPTIFCCSCTYLSSCGNVSGGGFNFRVEGKTPGRRERGRERERERERDRREREGEGEEGREVYFHIYRLKV